MLVTEEEAKRTVCPKRAGAYTVKSTVEMKVDVDFLDNPGAPPKTTTSMEQSPSMCLGTGCMWWVPVDGTYGRCGGATHG